MEAVRVGGAGKVVIRPPAHVWVLDRTAAAALLDGSASAGDTCRRRGLEISPVAVRGRLGRTGKTGGGKVSAKVGWIRMTWLTGTTAC